MEDCAQVTQETYKQDSQVCSELEAGGVSFSTPFISRTQDYSFSSRPSTMDDGQVWKSPALTCKTFFSSFQVDDDTPAFGGFSFSSCQELRAVEFSSLIPSMPSFTFSNPTSAIGPGNISLRSKADVSSFDVTYGGIHFLT